MPGWTKIRLRSVSWLCFDAPENLRWAWINTVDDGRTQIKLVSPRGVLWDFKLGSGAWIKRSDKNAG